MLEAMITRCSLAPDLLFWQLPLISVFTWKTNIPWKINGGFFSSYKTIYTVVINAHILLAAPLFS